MSSEEKKITPGDKKTLYISVLMIIALSIISFWRFKNLDFSTVSFSSPVPRDAESPSLQDILSEEGLEKMMKESGLFPDENEDETEYKRKKIEDRVLFDYPSSWEEITVTESKNENIDLLFLAYSQRSIYPTTLTMLKIRAEDIGEVVTIIKEYTEGTKEINVITEKEELEYLLEIDYSPLEELSTFTKAKVIFVEEHFYLLSLTFFENHPPHPSLIDYILSSVQIIE